MKIKLVIIAVIIIFLSACQNKKDSLLNERASIKQTNLLSINPLLEHVFTSSINVKNGTMSTLYGNETAWEYAKLNKEGKYPKGAILYEVNWYQKSDSVWFGANIPKEVKSIEKITYISDGVGKYELFTGKLLNKSKSINDSVRLAIITQQEIAVAP